MKARGCAHTRAARRVPSRLACRRCARGSCRAPCGREVAEVREPLRLGVVLALAGPGEHGGIASSPPACGSSPRATRSAPPRSRSYGAFWVSFWWLTGHTADSRSPAADAARASGSTCWSGGSSPPYMTVAASRVSGAVLAVFVLLTLTFLVLAIGASSPTPTASTKLGGYARLLTAIAAWYASFAGVTAFTFKRQVAAGRSRAEQHQRGRPPAGHLEGQRHPRVMGLGVHDEHRVQAREETTIVSEETLSNLLHEERRFDPPADLARERQRHGRRLRRGRPGPARVLGRAGRAADAGTRSRHRGARLEQPAVREVVRRRQAQRGVQLPRPARRGRPRRPGRLPLRGRAGRHPRRSPTPSCTDEVCQAANALTELGREGRRPGRDLHADDPRDGRRDAGLRPDRRPAHRGVRRLLRRRAATPDPGLRRRRS